MRALRNFGIIAVIALALAVLPGGGPTVDVVLRLLGVAFGTAIAFFGLRLYREHRFTLDSLTDFQRVVLVLLDRARRAGVRRLAAAPERRRRRARC